VIRIPLLLRDPNAAHAGERVRAAVRLVDVAPTLVDYGGIESPAQFAGSSLRPLLAGGDSRPVLSQLRHGPNYWSNAWIDRGRKLVRARQGSRESERLFQVMIDPAEELDLLASGIADDSGMGRDLEAAIAVAGQGRQDESEAVLDADTLERLRALGYVE